MGGAALLIPAIFLTAAFGREAGSVRQEVGGVIEFPGKDKPISPKVEEVFRVGVLQGGDWEMFGQISSVAFGPEGNLYVLDEQAKRIVVFGSDGTFLRTIGREGKGPGELPSPMRVGVLDDETIGVYDLGHRGITLFSPEGEHLGSVAFDLGTGLVPRELLPHPTKGGFVSLASKLSITLGPAGISLAPSDAKEGIPVVFFPARDGGVPEVLHRAWLPPREEPAMWRAGSTDSTMTFNDIRVAKAFDPGQYLGILPDGRMVLSDSTAYSLKVTSPEGEVVQRLRRPLRPKPVTREIQKKEKARRMEAMASVGRSGSATMTTTGTTGGVGGSGAGGGGGRIEMPPGLKKRMEEQLERLEFADVIPIVTGLAVDGEGRIWVERAGEDLGEAGPTDLITADGKYLGTISPKGVRIPNAFGPDGLMAYIEESDLGVPMVVVRRLTELGR